jgi:hypothetical protein
LNIFFGYIDDKIQIDMNNIKSFGDFINEMDFNPALLISNALNAKSDSDTTGTGSLNLDIPDTADQIALKSLGLNNVNDGSIFTPLDLKTSEGFKAYADIAQKWIDKTNPSSPIKGEMLALGAKKAVMDHGAYIPPQLALAQLTLEGGLSRDTSNKPIRTKNPFNVGNVDSGAVVNHNDWQSGIDAYYRTMAKSYVVPSQNKTAPELLKKFVNVNNQRYASAPDYERKLTSTINNINKTLTA